MTTIAFDPRKAVRNLKAVGFEESQADAIVDTLSDAFSDTIATKSDIAGVQSDIAGVQSDIARLEVSTKSDIARLEVSTKAGIADLKADMFRALWIQGAALVGLQLTIAGLLFAALKMFSQQ